MSTESSDQMSTADLVDLHGEALQSIPLQLRSFGRHPRFPGRAVTVKCFEDNALLKSTLGDWPNAAGAVLVVDGGGSLRTALVGDVIAGIAVDRGWARPGHQRSGPRQRRPEWSGDWHQSAGYEPAQEQQDRRRPG